MTRFRLHLVLTLLALLVTSTGKGAALDWQQESMHVRSAAAQVSTNGKTGFTLLSPEQTGVFFTNFIAQERHLTNQMLLNGSGLAAGDVDGDGLADLFFSGFEGQSRLYRNLGNWKFEDITKAAGLSLPKIYATGALLADLDGDGDLDLIVNSWGGGTLIFFNDGKGHFTRSDQNLDLNQGHFGLALAMADFDGDGALDLFIGNYRMESLQDQPDTQFMFKLVNGKPTVTAVNGHPLTEPGLTNRFAFFFDVNARGGKMRPEEFGEPSMLCRNDGHGHFTPVSWTAGAFLDENDRPLDHPPFDWTLSVMFRDLNGDGWPDLYTCSDYQTPDRVWLNDHHGHFRAAAPLALRHTSLSSMGVDVADIDRDGHDDLIVFDMLSPDHRRRFSQRIDLRQEAQPVGVIDHRPQYSRNTLFLNRGDETYAEIACLSGLEATDWSWTPLFLDVDLDGYEDLLVSNGFERDSMNMDAFALIDAAKAQRKLSALERLQLRKLFPRLATPNLAFRNLGNLRFADSSEAWGFHQQGVSQGMVAVDLDNDGDLDVVVNNMNGPAFLLRNDAPAPRLAVRLKGKPPNTRGIGAKLKVLGGSVLQTQEIIAGGRFLSSDDPIRTFACGSATNLHIEVFWRSGARSQFANARPNRIYEIDEAGAQRVAAPDSPSRVTPHASRTNFFSDMSHLLNHTHRDEPFDDFERQPLLDRKLSQLGPGVSWFDVDGDGWDDLIIGGGKGGELAVYRNDQKGGFTRMAGPPFTAPVTRDQTAVLGYRTPDGRATLLAGSANYEDGFAGGSAVRSYDMAGKTVNDILPGQASSTGPLALADIDGDGELDLFVGGRVVPGRYPEAASSLLFRGHGGKFVADAENTKQLASLGLVSGAIFSDLDGDGFPELILACEWGPIRIFRNHHGKLTPWNPPLTFYLQPSTFNPQPGTQNTPVGPPDTIHHPPSTILELTGWWNGVAAGDFDGDGRMDIVASNWGRNTTYEQSRAQALRLFYGDLDGNGAVELVMASFDAPMQKLVPTEPFDHVCAAIPWLREKMGGWTAYASASVSDIYGDKFKRLTELQAGCLETMIFLNRGDHFEAHELPIEAQLAPAFAVCVGDLDGSGHEDIFLSQNFFDVPNDTARYDAGRGLWLRGDGKGGFSAVPGQESGLRIYGEQRGAALCDYDGDGRVDLAVTQNGAETRLYRNTGARPGLRVRLNGPPGNPAGIGATIRLATGETLGPAREIHAGSGYWSQDSAVQVLGSPAVPTAVRVRWPGGKEVTGAIPAGAREIALDQAGKVTVTGRISN